MAYYFIKIILFLGFPGDSDGKESACNAGGLSSIPGSGRSPKEKEMATHSNILAWRIPWTEEPGRLQVAKSYTNVIFLFTIIFLWDEARERKGKTHHTQGVGSKNFESKVPHSPILRFK